MSQDPSSSDSDKTRAEPFLRPDEDRTRLEPFGPAGDGELRREHSGAAHQERHAPPRGHNALPNGTRLGEFEITRLIGEGGFGIVYLAYDVSLQRQVALKEYLPAALAVRRSDGNVAVISERHSETFDAGLRSFVNEAQLLARFDHPSLVKVYRFWQANGTAYMVMPYYEGPTLKDALRNLERAPDESWLKEIVSQLLDALEVIHSQNCFHRDISPDNILLLGNNRPVLLDFGAARRAITDMTQALTAILKPGYAPIEQYADSPSGKQGPWTDFYGLASVVHYAIVRKSPTPAVERVMSDTVVPLAKAAAGQYSDRFLRGIDAALSIRPEDRPRNVAEFRALLDLPPSGTASGPKTEVTEPAKPRRRTSNPRAIAIVVAAVAFALGVVALVQWNDRTRPPPASGTVGNRMSTPEAKEIVYPRFQPALVLTELLAKRDASQRVDVWVNGNQGNAQVPIGGLVRVDVRSSRAGYMYLFMLDTSQSNLYLLFPNVGKNDIPVTAGERIELRPPLRTTGPQGMDRYVAMVSDEPRKFEPPQWRIAEDFRAFALDDAAKAYASPQWLSLPFGGTPLCQAAGSPHCSESFGATQFTIEEVAATSSKK